MGSLKISLCEDRRLKDTQKLKCEDSRLQNCLALKTEDLTTKPEEDWRFGFLTGKIWFYVWLIKKTAPGDTFPKGAVRTSASKE